MGIYERKIRNDNVKQAIQQNNAFQIRQNGTLYNIPTPNGAIDPDAQRAVVQRERLDSEPEGTSLELTLNLWDEGDFVFVPYATLIERQDGTWLVTINRVYFDPSDPFATLDEAKAFITELGKRFEVLPYR